MSVTGGPRPSTVPFKNLNSFSFDGVDEYFLGTSTYSVLDGQNKATISFWIKPQDNAFRILLHVPRNNTNANGQFLIYQRDGRIHMNIDTSSYYCITPNNTLILNQWQHVMICMDLPISGAEGKIFINGVDQTSQENWYNRTALSTSTGGLYIGEANNGYQSPFLGNIDEVAIWSGTDLRNDVATIYNNGEPTDLNNNGLTAPTTWQRMGDLSTWNGTSWIMRDVNGRYVNRSINMVEANRTTDVPPNPFVNTKSISLDGVDDSVSLQNLTSRKVQTLTMSVWVKPTAFARDGVYLNGHTSYGNQGIEIYWSFNLYYARINGTSYFLGAGNGQNNWTHIAIAYDGNTLKRMTDGIILSDVVVGATINYTNYNGLTIGRSAYGNHIGNIDEVAFWDSDQSANFSTIYNGGVPGDLTSLVPLNWYRCGDGDTSPTLTDNGSGGNDGTMNNFSTFSTDVPTFSKRSIALDGVDDYVSVPNSTSLQFAESMSVSAWFKTSDNGGQMVIAGRGHIYSTTLSSWVLFRRTNNGIGVQLRSGNAFQYVLSTSNTYNDGQWHHVIFTRNISSGDLKLYIDGLLQNTTSGVTSDLNNVTQNTTIGADTQSAEYFLGNIDEVSLFNSELLASDVTSIYNGGVPNDISSLNPLSWWRCGDGDTSPTLTDNGSGSNDGTMNNFSTFSTDVPTIPFSTKSIALDGVDDTVSISSLPSTFTNLSISFWLKKGVDAFNAYVFARRTSQWLIFQNGSNNSLKYRLITNGGTYTKIGGAILDNTWHHCAFVWDSSANTFDIYEDGVKIGTSTTTSGSLISSTDTAYLFSFAGGAPYSSGNLDELAIFDSVLSQTDITSIYNGGVPNDITSLSPLSWWRCGDGDTSPTLTDNGSGGNDGTMTNFTTFSTDVPT